MLAMHPRTPWGVRCPASSLTTIASMLAPTGPWRPRINVSASYVFCRSEHAPGGVPTMDLRSPWGVRCPTSSLTTIASMLAPTGPWRPRINVSASYVFCRSEHARDAPENAVGCQVPRVIVDDHREHARSYRSVATTDQRLGKLCLCRSEHAPGGVPTMDLRSPWGVRCPASSLTTIASMLAPTGPWRTRINVPEYLQGFRAPGLRQEH